MAKNNLSEKRRFTFFNVTGKPEDTSEVPIEPRDKDIVTQVDSSEVNTVNQLSQFRSLATDRMSQYDSYDEMKTDSIIAAALELYADDATQYDEQGRIIWVESEVDEIAKAGNRLLDILDIPERAWKHIYQACLYGDYYLKMYRKGDLDENDEIDELINMKRGSVQVVNDKVDYKGHVDIPPYEEYVEDVVDPALIFDLKRRGRTAGFIEINKEVYSGLSSYLSSNTAAIFQIGDINVYRPDRFIHILIGEFMSRNPEEVEINLGDGKSVTYQTSRGKSILQDVYPIQKELQLLEDSLLLNRLTRSSLIRLLEVELGDMPKKEVNAYMRRIKSLIEQHISLDKDDGAYKSYNAPGPIDNVIYIPVRNGKGSVSINNLGGDVNVRDIADIDYFNNKRAGALKIPRAYLGDDMDGSGLSNGGSLTRLSIRYARTIKRIQTSYIRAITMMLNLFFIDKKLDYVNRFEVRMTSPSTQEDLERNELIANNVDLISGIMSLMESLQGYTQKKILNHLVTNILKMPEIATIIEDDKTPEEDINIDGDANIGNPSFGESDTDMSNDFEREYSETSSNENDESGEGFTQDEFSEFEDEI